MERIVAFHGNNGYANAPEFYVIHTEHCVSCWSFCWHKPC